MKGLELNVTKQNGMTLVEYQLGVADVYDDRVSDKVAQLGNIIPFQYKDEDGKRSIVSYVHHDTSLEVLLRQTLKKKDVLAILKGLLCAFEIGAAGVQICYLVRNPNYIYVDPESKAVKCIMVPVKQDALGQSDIPDFFRNIVAHMRFDEADKDDYVARILTLINTDHYSNMKLKALVDAEMEKLGLFYTRDEGLKKEADTTVAPDVQNQNKDVKVNRVGVMNNMRPQGMPPMGQPVPPMGGQPMGQPVPPMSGQPMMGQPVPPMGGQPMGQPVPPMGGQPMGQPVPPMSGQPMMGQPVPPMGGQPMGQSVPPMGGQPMGQPVPPMGGQPMMGQMPKPQAPAPEAPKPEMPKPQAPAPEAPKPEIPKPQAPAPEAPKPEMPKPQAPAPEVPKPEMPKPQAPAPEVPKPEMPKPQAPAPEAPKPEMPKPQAPAPEVPKPEMPKPQMPPMGQRPAIGGQPMMGQVPTMGQRPPMGQPMVGQMPRPQAPQMPNGNLMGQLGGARPIPHFVRKSTGEIINITKPEFVIGKSKTKADYAIENNSAISREHCIVVQRDGVNYIKDNNSTNHTYVNGVELQPGKEVLLKHKTEVRLGDEEFTFLLRKGE